MDQVKVVAGLDPATVGHTAAIVYAIDPKSQRRYVLDAFNEPHVTPVQMREMIKGFTTRYGVSEWRIERNAFQAYLSRDEEIRDWL